MQDGVHGVPVGLSVGGSLTGQHPIGGDAEGVDVGARVEDLAPDLLRGHERDFASQVAGLCLRAAQISFGNSEVQNLGDPVFADHEIVGADVAVNQMNQPPQLVGEGVGSVEAKGCISDGANDDVRGYSAHLFPRRSREAVQGQTIDVLHRDEELAAFFGQLIDLHDVWVADPGGHLGFASEHLHELLVGSEVR